MLAVRHPAFFDLSCDDCQRWQHVDGRLSRRVGLPVARVPGTVTPCWKCPKVPPSAPSKVRQHAVDPTARSRKALRHYRQCKAVGRFPDDPIVLRNAGAIAEVIETLEGHRLDVLLDMAAMALGAKKAGGAG